MNIKGRPPKPQQYKRHRLSVSVSFNSANGIRNYAASNGIEISEIADKAIAEFLKAHTPETCDDLFALPPV